MIVRASALKVAPRAAAALALPALVLCGCAGMGESLTTAFADPAKYELWDCKRLEPERKNLASRSAELQGLMAKADTGVAGPVVAELAYRNDYLAVRGQAQFAEDAWRRNRCQETPPTPPAAAAPPANAKPAPRSKAGTAVY